MEKRAIYDLHTEAKEWKNRLDFYRDDLEIMQKRVSEVERRNNGKEVLTFIEHFQNQIILQREQLDILDKEVRQLSHSLVEEINHNPTAADHRKVDNPNVLQEKVETFEKLFNDLRQELLRFVAKWL